MLELASFFGACRLRPTRNKRKPFIMPMQGRSAAELQLACVPRCRAAKFKDLLFLAAHRAPFGWLCRRFFGPGLGFFGQTKRLQTLGLCTSGANLNFIFDHRLSSVPHALFLFEISFCPLLGLL